MLDPSGVADGTVAVVEGLVDDRASPYKSVTPASLIDLSANCNVRKRAALQYPRIASQQLHIVNFEHLMQRALALQPSLKLELRLARVVLLLLALTSLLSRSASQPVQASDGPEFSDSLAHSNGEAGSTAKVASAEGQPAAKRSQHFAPTNNRAESSHESNFRGANHTAPLVCQTTEPFQVLMPPTADSCPAEGFIDKSAHGGHSKPACLPASSLLYFACQYITVASKVYAPCIILISFHWRQQKSSMQLHTKHCNCAPFDQFSSLTVQLRL